MENSQISMLKIAYMILVSTIHIGTAYLPVNSNWQQYIDSAETIFEDLKLESRQLLSLKADEACRMMNEDAYKKDLWMWDQDWSTQTLKMKKQIIKKKKKDKKDDNTAKVDEIELFDCKENIVTENQNVEDGKGEEFDVLCEEYIKSRQLKAPLMGKEIDELNEKFKYLYEMGKLLPVKRPYLAGYPAWYRKLCTKPGKDPDWIPGASNITTSMQVIMYEFLISLKYSFSLHL